MPLALYWLLQAAANDLHNRALREDADTVARYLVLRPDGSWALALPPALSEQYSQAYGRYAYSILDDGGHVLFSSLGKDTAIFPVSASRKPTAFLETRRGEATISGASIRKEVADRTVWIQVAEDLAHRDVLIDDIVSEFFGRVGWITLPILLVLLTIDIAIFRRVLRPVVQASQKAEKIGPARTDIRLPVAGMPREILPLVQAVNQALDRLEQGFRVQREFTADAAHELRTPLTILRTRIDTLSDQGAVAALRRDIAGMSRIVSQLLDIAELDTFVLDPSEKADLRAVCAEVVEFLAPLAVAQRKSIGLSGSEAAVWIKGNPEMLGQAVRNVAENAIGHAPEGTAVEVVVEKGGSVTVLDQGPGVPEGERELVFRRFWRRDRRRTGGAGLGLSIVQRIVELHGGTVAVSTRRQGGAEFSLRFALAEEPKSDDLERRHGPTSYHPAQNCSLHGMKRSPGSPERLEETFPHSAALDAGYKE
jgi:signal transduction histidine kinase